MGMLTWPTWPRCSLSTEHSHPSESPPAHFPKIMARPRNRRVVPSAADTQLLLAMPPNITVLRSPAQTILALACGTTAGFWIVRR